MIEIYKELLNIQLHGGEAVLATVISTKSHTPRDVGAKMLIRSDGTFIGTIGGGELELKLLDEAAKIIRERKPKILHFDLRGKKKDNDLDMICGGIMDVFVEPIFSKPMLYIFGAGHVSVQISKIAKMVNFRVVVIDNRKDYVDPEKFSGIADNVIVSEYAEAVRRLKIDEFTYIVIVTTEHKNDQEVLELVLKSSAKYIGMMGSPKKRDTIFSNLAARGFSKELFLKVHSPVGIEIGAETPEEIAVSITAELIKEMRTGA
jgi:xanthine dehydrogenase accessory factor